MKPIATPEISAVDVHEEIVPLLPGLSTDELMIGYKRIVGKDPKPRALDRTQLIAGIQDRKAELDRLAKIDRKADKEDLAQPYAR